MKKNKPPFDKVAYQKQYQRENRKLVCAVRARPEEAELLKELKRRSGMSWLKIIYRGLGQKRQDKFTC